MIPNSLAEVQQFATTISEIREPLGEGLFSQIFMSKIPKLEIKIQVHTNNHKFSII